MHLKTLFPLVVTSIAMLSATGTALAAPAGSESPSNCTFSKGTTTCSHVGDPVVTTSTGTDGAGCTLTYKTTTIPTTYSAHRGTYNSAGEAVPAPASTSTESTVLDSKVCPPAKTAKTICEDAGGTFDGTPTPTDYMHPGGTILLQCSGFGADWQTALYSVGYPWRPYCDAAASSFGARVGQVGTVNPTWDTGTPTNEEVCVVWS